VRISTPWNVSSSARHPLRGAVVSTERRRDLGEGDALVAGRRHLDEAHQVASPGTSEMMSASIRAGQAAAASWPPFTRERCLRRMFISPIGAPEASSASLTACFSASVMPPAGRTRSAEPLVEEMAEEGGRIGDAHGGKPRLEWRAISSTGAR
jgi:hypothetical protein